MTTLDWKIEKMLEDMGDVRNCSIRIDVPNQDRKELAEKCLDEHGIHKVEIGDKWGDYPLRFATPGAYAYRTHLITTHIVATEEHAKCGMCDYGVLDKDLEDGIYIQRYMRTNRIF